MKGHTDKTEGDIMANIIWIGMWVVFAAGYGAVLMLTERSAGRYVRGEIAPAPENARIFVTGLGGAPVEQAVPVRRLAMR